MATTKTPARAKTNRGKENDRELYLMREPDDFNHRTRILASEAPPADDPKGWMRDSERDYFVFRGDPEAVVRLLRRLLEQAEADLPAGRYSRRGQPGAIYLPLDL